MLYDQGSLDALRDLVHSLCTIAVMPGEPVGMQSDFANLGVSKFIPRAFGLSVHAYGSRKKHLSNLQGVTESELATLSFTEAFAGDQPRWNDWITGRGSESREDLPQWTPCGIPALHSRLLAPWTINVGIDVDIKWVPRLDFEGSLRDGAGDRDGLEQSTDMDTPAFEAMANSDGAPGVECHGLSSRTV